MVIKIRGSPFSSCTRPVITTLHELGTPYELITVDFAGGEHKSAPFKKLNPWGKIPVLEDDDFVLFESRAICKYLAVKFAAQGTSLIPHPKDVKAYGLFEQACSIELNYFKPPAEGLAVEKIFKALHGGGPADEVLVAKYAAELDACLAVYDVILSKQKYLAGDEFTLADLFHLPYGKSAIDTGFQEIFEKYPSVWAWWGRISGRESWTTTIEAKA